MNTFNADLAARCQRVLDNAASDRRRGVIADMVADRAAEMVLRPVMIPQAIGLGYEWPVPRMSYGDLIAKARARLAVAHRYPLYFVTDDLIDFQAAARAVEIIAVEGDRLPKSRRAA